MYRLIKQPGLCIRRKGDPHGEYAEQKELVEKKEPGTAFRYTASERNTSMWDLPALSKDRLSPTNPMRARINYKVQWFVSSKDSSRGRVLRY